MSAEVSGIHVENTVDVNWFKLGITLSHSGSDDQGDLLQGLAHGLEALGHGRSEMQQLYIANEVKGSEVLDMIRNILAFAEGEES